LLKQQDYYAFGKTSLETALTSSHNFSGKKYDGFSDLVFFGGRYYIPWLGIFLTPDPYYLDQQPEKFFSTPGNLKLYTYVQNNPVNILDPTGLWFGIDDAIAAGVGFVLGVGGYLVNWGMSGGDFSFSEMMYSGLMGAAALWLTYNLLPLGFVVFSGLSMLFGTAVCAAWDEASMEDGIGNRILGFLSFAIKFGRSPITSTVGLLIGFIGIGFGVWGDVSWFKGGVIAFEHDAGAEEWEFSGLTLGATVNIWHGNVGHAPFEHELYHSRQYTILGDAFGPAWLLGGVYGMISGKIGGSDDWGSCFYSANPDKGYGNPLEAGAQSVVRGGGCS
jgi:RHS repeat-associated protein